MDINAGDDTNTTAMMFAAIAGKAEIVHRLIELGADHTLADKSGRTALMLASARGHADVVKLLVENLQWDFDQADMNGRTALLLASSNGHVDVVKLLLIHHPQVDTEQRRKAAELARVGYHEHIEALLLSTVQDAKESNRAGLDKKENEKEDVSAAEGQAAEFEASSRNWLLKWTKPFWAPGADAIRTGTGLNGQADLYDIIESMTVSVDLQTSFKSFGGSNI